MIPSARPALLRQFIRRITNSGFISGLLITLLLSAKATASLDPARAFTQYVQEVWSTESGLPHSSVTAIAQTPDGYLWIGTEEGLARFDGFRFTRFNRNNTPGLRGSQVLSLICDHQGNLWIGTAGGGLTRYAGGKFTNFNAEDGLAGDTIYALHEDESGVLWIGTDGAGIFKYKEGQFETLHLSPTLPSQSVFTISGDPKSHTIWVGTHAGLVHIKGSKILNSWTRKDGLIDDFIKAVRVSRAGDVWVGTNTGGVSRIQADGKLQNLSGHDGLVGKSVWTISEDASGTVWVGTLDAGISRYREGRFSNYSSSHGAPSNRIMSFFEDKEGSLWIGTGGSGVMRLKNGPFITLSSQEGLPSDVVLPVFEDHERSTWLGTDGFGLIRLRAGEISSITTRNGLASDVIMSIAEDGENALWVSTRKGLDRIKNGQISHWGRESGLPGDIVLCLYRDRDGVLWAGSRGGLSRFDGQRFKTFTTVDGLPGNHILALYEDRDRNLWIGTATNGLSQYRNGQFTNFDAHSGLSSKSVWSLTGDEDGTVWIGTSGGGLNRYRMGKIQPFSLRDGALDDQVFQVLNDKAGSLWITSNNGITRLPKSALNDYMDGRRASFKLLHYGVADGLKNKECNGGFQPAGWLSHDGRLLFPTMQGVTIVDPSKLPNHDHAPNVLIEAATIDGKAYPGAASVRAEPGSGQMQFDFTALALSAPQKLEFKYKLENFDQDWIDSNKRRSAYYTNIPPGEYTFRVLASTGDGKWDEKGAALAVTLVPHYYQTAWFKALCVLTVIGSCVIGYRFRVGQLQKREQLLLRLVDERTKALQEQIAATEQALADLAQAQETMIEMSRMSGRAEVATGVLHNVGNVLNSVNVGASVIADRITKLRLDHLAASVKLLESNLPDLTTFVTSDPKGQRVIPYLSKLCGHLQNERDYLMSEISDLTKHIDHMKAVVATQQNYAKMSELNELISLPSLVNDAIQVVKLSKSALEIVKDFDELPKIHTSKHKTLEILVNLLTNAEHAVLAHSGADRKVTVSLKPYGSSRIRITVRDTGMGIAKENLTRIFAHGFTTKPKGHGFGLHSCAIAARQLGGALWAESDGLGHGASFVLELPVDSKVVGKEDEVASQEKDAA